MLRQRTLGLQSDLARAKPRFPYGDCDLGWIETSLFFGADNSPPLFEVDLDLTDALQAPQGLLGPVRSQGSRHAINA